jgi:cyclopropane fatty-acyl-phospholipid synthase-like methyltransferase
LTTPSWDAAYADETPAPWDIGRPQPAFVRLADQGMLSGHVLDVGCGTGEHALLAATHGACAALGIDLSARAIAKARAKAAERGISASFQVGDALKLAQLGQSFDTAIDSGLFHVFSDEDRVRYVASLATALTPAGRICLMCFSDRQPGDFGPRRVSEAELRTAFAEGWALESITADTFEINPFPTATTAHAWLAIIRRL